MNYFLSTGKVNVEFPVQNEFGGTALSLAAQNGRFNVVKLLVENYKANFISPNKKGATPLHLAAEKGDVEVVNYLLSTGEVNIEFPVQDEFGNTALAIAIYNARFNVIKLLVEKYKANCISPNKKGFTPLHIAAEEGNIEVVDYLLTTGQVNIEFPTQDGFGNTALGLAVRYGRFNIVMLLIEKYKADYHHTNKKGGTPLHIAAWTGQIDLVKYLVKNNADINITDQVNKMTPLHYAAGFGHIIVVMWLLRQQNISVHLRTDQSLSPLDIAAQQKQIDCVIALYDSSFLSNKETLRNCLSVSKPKANQLMRCVFAHEDKPHVLNKALNIEENKALNIKEFKLNQYISEPVDTIMNVAAKYREFMQLTRLPCFEAIMIERAVQQLKEFMGVEKNIFTQLFKRIPRGPVNKIAKFSLSEPLLSCLKTQPKEIIEAFPVPSQNTRLSFWTQFNSNLQLSKEGAERVTKRHRAQSR